MVLALGVALQLRRIEIDGAQITACISLGLIVEMPRRRVAAFSSRCDGPCMYLRTKINDADEAVANGSVPVLRVRVGTRTISRKGTPRGGNKRYGDARLGIVKLRMEDAVVETLKAVDFAPRRLPRSEIGGHSVGSRG